MKRILFAIYLLAMCHPVLFAQITGRIDLQAEDFTYTKLDGYDVIKAKGCHEVTGKVGAPELPTVVRTFVVPLDVSVTDVDVVVTGSTVLRDNVIPYPVQAPIPIDGEGHAEPTIPDSSIYNGTAVYPGKHAEVIADYNELGYHIIKVRISPVTWNPVTGKLYLHALNFTLNYSNATEAYISPQAQSRYRSRMIKNVVKAMVDNPQDMEACADKKVKIGGVRSGSTMERTASESDVMTVDVLAEQIPDYIIITSKELKGEFQRLADWKIQKGIPTIIKDIDEIKEEYLGADTPEKIHAYLHECYMKWGEGLFVLLGGDTNIIPARFYKASSEEHFSICPSDVYYSDLMCNWNSNNNHLYAERGIDAVSLNSNCYIGRASVENISEAGLFVNKVLAYEKMNNPSVDTGYLINNLAVSAYIAKYGNTLFASAKTDIDDALKKYPQLKGHTWYIFDHYNCTCSNHADKRQYTRGQELNKNNFIAALNDGGASGLNNFHIVYHMDHSSPRTIGTSSMDKLENMSIQEIDNLNNGDYQQIVISGGCETTRFDLDCVAEHFVNNPKGGAVAFIGNANVGYSNEQYQYIRFLNEVYGKSHDLSLGVILQKMPKVYTYPTEQDDHTPDKMRLHLIGDPEMPVWSAVPQNFDTDISLSSSVPGDNELTLKVNNLPAGERALVCLFKDKEVFTTIEINDTLQHRFAMNVKSGGCLKATVTARNFIPYEKDIMLEGIGIGDGPLKIEKITGFDGSINIGDSAIISICLKNMGNTNATNVRASLYTNSPYIKIIKGDNVSYGTIAANNSVSRGFKIGVDDDALEIGRNEWNAPCLYLKTQDAANTVSVDTFKIDITSPRLRISRVEVTKTGNGDFVPEAGEYVELSFESVRLGKKPLGSTRWQLTPMTDDITEVLVRGTRSRIKVADSYDTANPLNLKFVLMSGGVPQDSSIVNVAEKLPVIGLDNIHSTQTSDKISLYWDKVGTVSKYNVYRSSSENGTYVRLNKMPLTARYYSDEDLSARTAFYYRVAAVAESCLEGRQSESFMTRTTIPVILHKEQLSKNNIPYHYECEANAVDMDYDGEKEIVLVSYDNATGLQSAVVVVNPDGTEPYCIDGNVTVFGGFALSDWNISAVPTVADLYGKGEMSIVTLSRRFGNDENYAVCYSVLDKDGNNLPDKLWARPSGVNVYRGAVATDIDAPDGKGKKELIFIGENKRIVVLNANGTIRTTFGDNITGNYGGLAVADLDNDGYKEIIYGQAENLYVWKHDGSPYLRSPFFTRSGMNMKSSPVVCDIDNDGEKEIIVATRTNPSYIYAIKQDGTCVGNFDSRMTNPVKIPYPLGAHEGIDHAVSVGDINSDGKLEVVALGGGCVMAWTNTGERIFNRSISGLFNPDKWAKHITMPLLADVNGDSSVDIVFNVGNRICMLDNNGQDIDGYQLTGDFEFSNNIFISDIDDDGLNEIVAPDRSGFITVWKTGGSLVEWGRARFDAGFTGEYIPGYKEMMVVKSDMEWPGGTYTNDIVVRSGTMRIVSGKDLEMQPSYKLIVMDGGALEIDGGTVNNANIFVKSGGMLVVKNNAHVKLAKYASLDSEKGAVMEVDYGCIE